MVLRTSVCLAVLLGVLIPDSAAACAPDPCAGAVAFAALEPASEDEMPVDGVLVLQAYWFGEFENQELLDGLTLAVDRGGEPVEGALEATDLSGVLLWRPAAPLEPGATYRVSGSFNNSGEVPAECAAAEVEVDFDFVTASGPAEAMVAPEIWANATLDELPLDELDALVCCDGAVPREQVVCDIAHGLTWSEGQCTSARARARLKVDIRAPAGVEDSTASQWVLRLIHDGEPAGTTFGTRFTRYLTGPGCFSLERRSLATGEVTVSEERCVGEGLDEELDEVAVDPMATLAGACEGAPYTCEVVDGAWDPEACTPWSAGAGGEELRVGCGCAGGDAYSGLAWLAPWLLTRRRRRG